MARGETRGNGSKDLQTVRGEDKRPLVVGIGASAGGLEAFASFFSKMPADSGLAFLLVQHLDPDHKSILTELISRQTTMAVTEAVDDAPIRANAIFVIPPDATLTIADGRLRVERPAPPRRTRFPIDSLFTSLAENLGEGAVGIILSGTGSDGTLGVRAIKTHGGLALAQAGDDHAPLNGMPQSAVATGLVDDVLKVDDMPARLIEYARHLQGVAPLKDGDGARRDLDDHLATISALLRTAIGHDFGQYKRNTLARRVQRRMQVLQIESVPEFIERLRHDPPQLQLLFREFLIGVTQFFRDPEAFEALRVSGLAKLFEGGAETLEPIRIWVPACATGEEVYSIAILLSEEMERRGVARQVQIFGTDIDDVAVATARTACYPATMTGVSSERLERWFAPRGDGFSPIKPIREMCIFSVHSIIRDPPFSKLDLISCRNLMIYLDGGLQDKVLRCFHYALKPGRLLFLGPSEGLAHGSRLFSVIDKRHRIFERRQTDTPTRLPDFPSARIETPEPKPAPDDRIERNVRNALEKHSPAYVVVDDHYDVVRFSGGGIGRYLEPAGGPPSLNLFSLLLRTLRPVVRTAVQQVFGEGRSFVEDQISVRIDGASRAVKVIAEPLGGGQEKGRLCVIAFQALILPPGRAGKHANEPTDVAARDSELQAQLFAATTDLEAAREEAASAVEEQQSINEELQSSNEELETAKEEMQSINEELQTVNAELSNKNDQLMRSNSDLQNLLDSTDIATVFLDPELRVKGYTPAMTELFHLRDADRGRPLDEVVSRIAYGDLRQDVMTVLRDARTMEREVEIAHGGTTYIMRMRPYRTLDGVIDGVVITFVDISGRKAMEEALREHAAIVEFSQDALISLTVDGRIRSWNPGAERLFGYDAAQACGRNIVSLLGDAGVHERLMAQAKGGQIAGPVATTWGRRDGVKVDVEIAVMPIKASDGAIIALALSARGIAERIEAEKHRMLMVHELGHRVKNALAIVQAIAAQTFKTTPPEEFTATFSDRLAALAKTHDLLTREDCQAALLGDVIQAELAPYQNAAGAPRWTCEGPDVLLSAKILFALGMAFHELATNAAKYGAFSNPGGRVDVAWTQQSGEKGYRLKVDWVESGGPPVATPTRRGFGTKLISGCLEGDVVLNFDPAGLRVSIDTELPAPGTG